MSDANLENLDNLITLCRSKEAKSYIREAVACYQAGAYRACVISTWTAVVFDFIDKLRELELAGDRNAAKQITDLDKIIASNDLKGSLGFESNLLKSAKDDFELISQTEQDELQRLHDDRHRCAHPSMRAVGEPFQPAAEIARYHMRNAVHYLLQHPPVQGKAALNRLISDIESEYFPAISTDAIEYFKEGPLKRPRKSLVRALVIVILKTLFRDRSATHLPMSRHIAALEALLDLHPAITKECIAENLNEIVRLVPDNELKDTIQTLYFVVWLWDYFGDDTRHRYKNYIHSMPEAEMEDLLWWALESPPLTAVALEIVDHLTPLQLANLIHDYTSIETIPPQQVIEKAIQFYVESESFNEANGKGMKLIIPIAPMLNEAQVKHIFAAIVDNYEIWGSNEAGRVISAIKEADGRNYSGFLELYKDLEQRAIQQYGRNRFSLGDKFVDDPD